MNVNSLHAVISIVFIIRSSTYATVAQDGPTGLVMGKVEISQGDDSKSVTIVGVDNHIFSSEFINTSAAGRRGAIRHVVLPINSQRRL